MNGPETSTATGEGFADTAPVAAHHHTALELQMQTQDIKLPAEIEALCREPIVHDGRRVMTTEQLAIAYGTDAGNITDNLNRNQDRFVEGAHFVKLTGEALKQFKMQTAHSGLVHKKASQLILWLERGAARHAKLVQTDEAWEVFGKLEDAYFDAATAPLPVSAVKPAISREVRLQMAQSMKLAQLVGLSGNQQIAAASRATRALTGFDYLAELGVTRLPAPEPQQVLTAGELGSRLSSPMEAREMNLWLTTQGYQTATRGWSGRLKYEATAKGQQFSEMCDVPLETGRSQRQLVWRTSMIAVVDAAREIA